MDESRRQFEEVAANKLNFDISTVAASRNGDAYDSGILSVWWYFWQQSRAAIEIKLPPKAESSPYEHYMPHYTMDADSVESAIRAAGIKVKE